MLAFPVASGFLVAGVTWAGAAFAALAIVGFLAHASAMIVLGARGGRLRGAHGTHARRRLLALGFVALACVTVVVATAPPGLWTPALGTFVLALLRGSPSRCGPNQVRLRASCSSPRRSLPCTPSSRPPPAPPARPPGSPWWSGSSPSPSRPSGSTRSRPASRGRGRAGGRSGPPRRWPSSSWWPAWRRGGQWGSGSVSPPHPRRCCAGGGGAPRPPPPPQARGVELRGDGPSHPRPGDGLPVGELSATGLAPGRFEPPGHEPPEVGVRVGQVGSAARRRRPRGRPVFRLAPYARPLAGSDAEASPCPAGRI